MSTDISCHDFVLGGLISGPGRVLLDTQTQAMIDTSVVVVAAENDVQDGLIAGKQNQLLDFTQAGQVSLLNSNALKHHSGWHGRYADRCY